MMFIQLLLETFRAPMHSFVTVVRRDACRFPRELSVILFPLYPELERAKPWHNHQT